MVACVLMYVMTFKIPTLNFKSFSNTRFRVLNVERSESVSSSCHKDRTRAQDSDRIFLQYLLAVSFPLIISTLYTRSSYFSLSNKSIIELFFALLCPHFASQCVEHVIFSLLLDLAFNFFSSWFSQRINDFYQKTKKEAYE